jgi:hypothetical protein
MGMAQLTNLPVLDVPNTFNVFRQLKTPFMFEAPTASYILPSLSEADKEKLRGFGLREEPSRPNVFLGNPAEENLSAILGMGPQDGRINPGTVTADGYLAFIYALKGLGLYSWASQKVDAQGEFNVLMPGFAQYQDHSKTKPEDLRLSIGGTIQKLAPVVATAMLAHPMKHSMVMYGSSQIVYSPVDGSGSIVPNVRKPGDAEVMGEKGIYCGYFAGMNLPDKDYMAHVFGNLFNRSLGPSVETSFKLMQRIRKGMRSLAVFRGGQALSHAYLGVELSRMGRCPVTFVVHNSVYHGFVLTGQITITHYKTVIPVCESDALKEDIDSINMHDIALGKILAILNMPVNSDGKPVYSFTVNDVKSSRMLASAIRSINQDLYVSTTWKSDLKDAFGGLSFGDKYAVATPQSITDFLRFVLSGDEKSLEGYPFLLTGRIVEESDRVSFGLSMFGTTCPTLNYGDKGQTFVLPGLAATDPNLAVPQGGHRALRFLPFKLEPYSLAVTQWRSVFSKGSFVIPNGRKGKAEFTDSRHVALKISVDPHFTTVYQLLKDVAVSQKNQPGKKRKRNEDEGTAGEASSSKKVRKDAEDDAMLV